MAGVEQRLVAFDLELPVVSPPQVNYLLYARKRNLVFIAGQGQHVRIASGMHSLPSGMAVEIEALAEIR